MNNIKTLFLLVILSSLFMLLGTLFGGKQGLHMALILALVMNVITYFFAEKIVLSLYRAQPLDKEQYNWIYEIVGELAHSMHIPMPKLWLISSPMANAFATGRNPYHASVAVTSGILSLLNKDELRGVLAHELSHIKNRDILVATIAATIATAIGYLAHMLQYAAFWGSIGDRRRNGNPMIMFLVALLMPIAATIIQLAISRSREYLADETGAHYSHDPLALASALEKLHENVQYAHLRNDDTQRASTAFLFIVHPFIPRNWISLFSTHPPIDKRIKKLQQMYEKIF